jgi:hypothetical protein
MYRESFFGDDALHLAPEGDSVLKRDFDCVGQKALDFTVALGCRLPLCGRLCELREFAQILKNQTKDKERK